MPTKPEKQPDEFKEETSLEDANVRLKQQHNELAEHRRFFRKLALFALLMAGVTAYSYLDTKNLHIQNDLLRLMVLNERDLRKREVDINEEEIEMLNDEIVGLNEIRKTEIVVADEIIERWEDIVKRQRKLIDSCQSTLPRASSSPPTYPLPQPAL